MSTDNTRPSLQLATYFPYVVRVFYLDVTETVKNVYTSLFGLSVSEWRTMANLYDFEPLSAKEIVSRSSMDKVNVSRSISSLQKSSLLERHIDPTDRRRVLLRLTRQGKQVMRELVPLVQDVEKQLMSGLNDKEQDTLKRLMHKVSLNARSIQETQLENQTRKRARAS